jgi:hypothetical protein
MFDRQYISVDISEEQVYDWTSFSTFPTERSMKSHPAPTLRVLFSVLLCLALTGAADASASIGPVVGWGRDNYGQATPPDAVNGDSGFATAIAMGGNHTLAIVALPEPYAWLARLAGLALLCTLRRSRTRKHRGVESEKKLRFLQCPTGSVRLGERRHE